MDVVDDTEQNTKSNTYTGKSRASGSAFLHCMTGMLLAGMLLAGMLLAGILSAGMLQVYFQPIIRGGSENFLALF